MRRILRNVAWLIIVGGPIAALLTFVQLFSTLSMPLLSGGLPNWMVVANTLAQLVFSAATSIAVGGGLLVILDMDARENKTGASEV